MDGVVRSNFDPETPYRILMAMSGGMNAYLARFISNLEQRGRQHGVPFVAVEESNTKRRHNPDTDRDYYDT